MQETKLELSEEFLIRSLSTLRHDWENMASCDVNHWLDGLIRSLKDGLFDHASRFDGDASPRFQANAHFQPVRIDGGASIPIPPGYEVVIRKAP